MPSRTSGAEGGPGRRNGSNPNTAPRSDPYIMGNQQRSAIATLVERRTRLTLLVPLPGGHTAQSVGDALIGALMPLPAPLRRSLTWDQGNEMFHHLRVEAATGIRIYFADARSPWQRWTNENTGAAPPVLPQEQRPGRLDEPSTSSASPPNSTPDPASASTASPRTKPCDDQPVTSSPSPFATTTRNRPPCPRSPAPDAASGAIDSKDLP